MCKEKRSCSIHTLFLSKSEPFSLQMNLPTNVFELLSAAFQTHFDSNENVIYLICLHL